MKSDNGRPDDRYARFARFYDLEFGSFVDDLDFYREFAQQANGPILELGCGTGRVLLALEDTGLPLAGIDDSAAMLVRARSRLRPETQLAEASMGEVATANLTNGPYWMAFAAINTFLHLETVAEQLTTLRALREVVVSGGLLLLDLLVPEPAYLADLDGRVQHEFAWMGAAGDRLDKWVSRTHDLATQTIHTTVYFDTTNARTGAVSRVVDRYTTRYIQRFELEHLLARAGWELVSLYGSYDLEPFHADAERMLALATWHP
jgi:SAM-dependent methyltransferase